MKALSVVRRRHGRTNNDISAWTGCTASGSEMEGSPRQQGDDDSQRAKRIRSENILPEDILLHIHALMPMRDAARAACVSRAFLRSWRCYPKLILDTEALGIKDTIDPNTENTEEFISEVRRLLPSKKYQISDLSSAYDQVIQNRFDQTRRDFASRVDHIMQNHSGTGVKTFRLGTYPFGTYPYGSLHPSYIDRLLQVVITPGIEEFELAMPCSGKLYNFPCSLLSTERGSSIQSFFLFNCAFHPAVEDGHLSSLTSVCLRSVAITGEELCCFLSNSFALELLNLSDCHSITFLKIPYELSRLSSLQLFNCGRLEMLESNASNLSFFDYVGSTIRVSLGDPVKLRKMHISSSSLQANMLYYASANLTPVALNLETLVPSPRDETINTPMVPGKFIYLKYLNIVLVTSDRSPDYDFYSLVQFLDAFPALETFIMRVEQPAIRHDSILEYSDSNSLHLRRLSEYRHDNLKNVMITGFCSAKSMIELTSHIIENAASLECLTLDTTLGHDRRFHKVDKCLQMSKEAIMEAQKALLAIGRYIEGKVPSTVNLKIIEPCSTCQY